MKIEMLPVFEDNFIFILIDEIKKEAAVVDPAEANSVISYLKKNNLTLTKIFNTHHHFDHVGGNKELKQLFPNVEIYGSVQDKNRIPFQTHFLNHNDKIYFADESAEVFFVPGHTLGHICYFFSLKNGEHHLFIGDTIFGGGCGKLFEGSLEQMFNSLLFLRNNLPDNTLIWTAHEYTLENYLILEKLEPQNIEIKEKLQKVIHTLKSGLHTVPFLLSEEKKVSSFLRWDDLKLQNITSTSNSFDTFCFVRKFRDNPPKIVKPF
ncbi:hydroxyacylglutathione hydrolase [Pigmentibacter sp. JX0631]|uniref:hydroxyacylglutathione hydrolase n=1 Tax=Pigmentibacter sp. JX0631 TaxID=2976982 RepID=UPI002468FF9E|nr:hydroxyacylglutathione hydrolase [Pigmentibacter sp. JX0631]WGL61320.1 hydroxyacylglutathione hydrolase [Pigmentibacter sp. JX0631]